MEGVSAREKPVDGKECNQHDASTIQTNARESEKLGSKLLLEHAPVLSPPVARLLPGAGILNGTCFVDGH